MSDGFGPDLIGDEEDRRRLELMTEVEREAVLYERAQARLAKAERRELEKKMRELESGASRPSRGPSAAMEKKRKTLDELRARREKRRRNQSDSDYYDSEEEGELKDRRKGGRPSSSEYEEDYYQSSRSTTKKSLSSTATEILDLENANHLLIRRNSLSKWIFHPQFDDLSRGCLLRLSIGFKGNEQVYRPVELCKIVKYHRTYKINDVITNKAAVVRYGKSERTFRLDVVSNSDITEQEFDRWITTLKEEHQPIITKKASQSRIDKWREFESKPVSDEIVSIMVAAKRKLGSAPRNLIAERTMLQHLRDEAMAGGNTVEVDRIDEELSQLEKEQASLSTRTGVDSRLEALAELNKRNRRLNVTVAREAEKKSGKRSESDSRLDPFSRRKCQPTNFNVLFDTADSESDQSSSQAVETKNGVPVPEEERLNEQASEEDVPTGPIDLFAAHNVDIEIDI